MPYIPRETKYDETLQGVLPREKNKYDDLLSGIKKSQEIDLRSALSESTKVTPDRQARIFEIAKKRNLPPGFVERNFDQYDKEDIAASVDYENLRKTPRLSRWLTQEGNASLVANDIEQISGMEKATQFAGDYFGSFAAGAGKFAGMGLSGIGELWEISARYSSKSLKLVLPDEWVDAMDAVPIPEGVGRWVLPNRILKSAGAGFSGISQALMPPPERQTLGTDIAEGLGQLTAQIGLFFIPGGPAASALSTTARTAPTLGRTLQTFALAGQGAAIMAEKTKGDVAPQWKKDLAVIGGAWITPLTEKYGLDLILNRIPPAIRNKFLQKIADVAIAGGIEAAQEFTEGLAHDLTRKGLTNEQAKLLEGIEREMTAAFGVGFIARLFITSMFGKARDSKMRKISLEKFGEVVSEITKGTPVEKGYIRLSKWDSHFKEIKDDLGNPVNPRTKWIEVTGDEKSYDEAKFLKDGDLPISMADALSKLDPAEHMVFFQENLRFDPTHETEEETRERLKIEAEAKAELEIPAGEAIEKATGLVGPEVLKGRAVFFTQPEKPAKPKAKKVRAPTGEKVIIPSEIAKDLTPEAAELASDLAAEEVAAAEESVSPIINFLESDPLSASSSEMKSLMKSEDLKITNLGKIISKKKRGKLGRDLDEAASDLTDPNVAAQFGIPPFESDIDARRAIEEAIREHASRKVGKVSFRERLIEKAKDIASIRKFLSSTDALQKLDFLPKDLKAQADFAMSTGDLALLKDAFSSADVPISKVKTPALEQATERAAREVLSEQREKGARGKRKQLALIGKQAKAIADRVKGQIAAAGQPRTAAVFSDLLRRNLIARSFQEGTTPEEIFGLRALEVSRERGGRPTQTLAQEFRGRIEFEGKVARIILAGSADSSTFPHELAHYFAFQLSDLAAKPDASQSIKEEYAATLQWLGEQDHEKALKEIERNIARAKKDPSQAGLVKTMQEALDFAKSKGGASYLAEVAKSLGRNVERSDFRAILAAPYHEHFARGFELWLREGKAPSRGLRGAFRRFKEWMIDLYHSSAELRTSLTPSMRRVFQKMLSTEEEIRLAQSDIWFQPLFDDAKKAGATDVQAERYARLRGDVIRSAEEKFLKSEMEEITREGEEEYKQRRKKVEAETRAEINARPEYEALDVLQSEPVADAPPVKISKEAIIEFYGEDALKTLPEDVTASEVDGGAHPDAIADTLGYRTGLDLLNAISGLEPRESAISRITDQKMLERYGEPKTPQETQREAQDALHGTDTEELMLLELQILSESIKAVRVGVQIVGKSPLRLPVLKTLHEQAARIVRSKKLKDLNPRIFQAAEARANQDATIAASKGDLDATFEARGLALLNHVLYRFSLDAQKNREKAFRKWKVLAKSEKQLSKTRDIDFINAARSLLSKFGIGNFEEKAGDYLGKLERYDPERFAAFSKEIAEMEKQAENYEDITYQKFLELQVSVDALINLSSTEKKATVRGIKIQISGIQDEMTATLEKIKEIKFAARKTGAESIRESFNKLLLSIKAANRLVESWADSMDGGDIDGAFTKNLWELVFNAGVEYRKQKVVYYDKIQEALKPIAKGLTREKIMAPELGNFEFNNKGQLLMAIAHTGNDSSFSKLLRGWGWGHLDENGILDTSRWDRFMARMYKTESNPDGIITKQDMEAIKGVWNILEELKPGAQKAYKEIFGRFFDEIKPRKILTPWGVVEGGYFPAKPDPTQDPTAGRYERNLRLDETKQFQFGVEIPTTGSGFTKPRIETFARPLLLDINLIPNHVDHVLRFSIIEPRIVDARKILLSGPDFKNTLDAFDPSVIDEMLVPWLKRAARQQLGRPTGNGAAFRALDTGVMFLRRSAAMAIMFFNLNNGLQQFAGASIAAQKVPPAYLAGALKLYLQDPAGVVAKLQEDSFFRQRIQNQLIEARDTMKTLLLNPTPYQKAQNYSAKHEYFIQVFMQHQVDIVAMLGAYNQAMAETKGMTHEKALRIAGRAVRLTQGSFDPESVSRIQTGVPIWRAMMTFTNYWNMVANLQGTEGAKILRESGFRKGFGGLLYLFTTTLAANSAISYAIHALMRGGIPDEEDDGVLDDILIGWSKEIYDQVISMATPIGRNIIEEVLPIDRRWNNDLFDSPGGRLLKESLGVPAEFAKAIFTEKELNKRDIKDLLNLVGLITLTPFGVFARPIGYLYDVESGAVEEPTGPIDYIRGLATGIGRRE